MATQTLTFLFADIEGSTAMVQRLGDAWAGVAADYHRLIRAGVTAHGGEEVVTQGDGIFAVFASPRACVDAVIQMQRALVSHAWPAGERVRVRMGIHCGEASQTAAGLEVHEASRIAAAHGGQVVVSAAAARLLVGALPDGVWLADLGLHRLKDVSRPEQIFQLRAEGLPAAFLPLLSLEDPRLRSNLPAQVSSFIGRDGELAAVRALVSGSRLVTLTGAGGAGKTRLGLQVAAGLADGAGDGVWFADLAPLGDPDLVAVTVADVLGVRQEPGRPVLDTLVGAVGGQGLLLLLDNCEHVIGACAKLADALLRGCPNLALLATSREPLGVDGERIYRVPSMRTPADGDDTAAIRASEAVRLFTDRAEHHGVRAGLERGDCLGHRPHLPAAGWHPAGRGAGRGPAAGDADGRAGCPAGPAVHPADRGVAGGPAAAADAAGDGRVVVGAADRRRAGGAGPPVGVRWGI